MKQQTKSYLFLTFNTSHVRNAHRRLEDLSAKAPSLGTQPEAEREQQRRIWALKSLSQKRKAKGKKESSVATPRELARQLKQCRNDKPCGNAVCAHCTRESHLHQLKQWLQLVKTGASYRAVTLTFNQEACSSQMMDQWSKAEGGKTLEKLKQRIGKTLKRIGCKGPVIGTFTLEHHALHEQETGGYSWLPQLRLLLPNDKDMLAALQKHMERAGNCYINAIVSNRPMCVHAFKDLGKQLRYVLDPMWHSVSCSVDTKDKRLIKGTSVPLGGSSFANSLLVLDCLGKNKITFTYGEIKGKA